MISRRRHRPWERIKDREAVAAVLVEEAGCSILSLLLGQGVRGAGVEEVWGWALG